MFTNNRFKKNENKNEVELQLAEVYSIILNSDKHNFWIPAGRDSGKTKNLSIIIVLCLLSFKEEDITIFRSAYGSMRDSNYAEVTSIINSNPKLKTMFKIKKAPLRVERLDGGCNCYFFGAGGDIDRTKGLKTTHKIGLAVCDETQQLKDYETFDSLQQTIFRAFSPTYKFISLGNPPARLSHWFNRQTLVYQKDNDWVVIKPTWKDILPFLNDFDLKKILKERINNYDYYKWIYEGVPNGASGRVYPMIREDIHLIDYSNRNKSVLSDFRIVGVIIGVDSAVNNDCTALVPRFIMSNGQSVAGSIFYHNPKINGVKGSFPLVEQEISNWFTNLIKENNLDNDYFKIPIIFVVDSAAAEMIQALRYKFSNRAEVRAIQKGTILQMVDVVQSAYNKNVCFIYDYGGYYNYTLNSFIKCSNILMEQYQNLVWNKNEDGYDNKIPNDVSDADTYAIYYYYKHTENIAWLDAITRIRKNYYYIKK